MLKLDIGSGANPLDGYVPIDIKDGNDAYPLDYEDGSVDEIHASHVLEHIPSAQTIPCLREWYRVLRPSGRLRVAVPDFRWIVENYQSDNRDPNAMRYLMGGQTDEYDYHKAVFDEPGLRWALGQCGFFRVRPWAGEEGTCAALPVSLNLEAIKPSLSVKALAHLSDIAVAMTVPRYGSMLNVDCLTNAVSKLGISNVFRESGAFYGQGMERAVTKAVEVADWVLCIDYDTIFEPDDVAYLRMLAEEYDSGAIAALQSSREANQWIVIGDGYQTTDFYGDVAEVKGAHFGLTLIRSERIQAMPRPWFQSEPNPDTGEWDNKRTDADAYFWREFRNAGGTVHLATQCSVGHLQEMISWPSHEFGVIHQYRNSYVEHGRPIEARGISVKGEEAE